MDGFDCLGAIDTSLSDQYITVRVRGIDSEKLVGALAKEGYGTFASAGLHLINAAPRAMLDTAIPIAVGKAKEYGIDAEVSVATSPPNSGQRAASEFWPGLAIGLGVGGGSLAIYKLFAYLLAR